MPKRKYEEGQKIGPYNTLLIKRFLKNKICYGTFQCSFCGKGFDTQIGSIANGHTKSCGCQKDNSDKIIDITGKRFGRLQVLERTNQRKGKSIVWKCRCDCGNIYYTPAQPLKDGLIISCGCYMREKARKLGKQNAFDLTNQIFGKLTCLYPINKNNKRFWVCQCECGSIIEVITADLIDGHTQSCGCLKSKGEEKISKILNELSIKYVKEKTFQDCKSEKKLRFDFYLPCYNCCIEYDGIQHFQPIERMGGEKEFKALKDRDEIKNQYCKEKNIGLIRIKYTDYENLNKDFLLNRIQRKE